MCRARAPRAWPALRCRCPVGARSSLRGLSARLARRLGLGLRSLRGGLAGALARLFDGLWRLDFWSLRLRGFRLRGLGLGFALGLFLVGAREVPFVFLVALEVRLVPTRA